MEMHALAISDVLLLTPKVFGDERGFFYESFNDRIFREMTRLDVSFVQDNHARSVCNVLRGLHYQLPNPQGKLVRAIRGEVFDVAVDLRQSSPTFGQWVGEVLSAENKKQIWVPEGFAHGYLVLSETAEILYKTTDFYVPEHENCIAWDDLAIGIQWPLEQSPVLSPKDANAISFRDAPAFA